MAKTIDVEITYNGKNEIVKIKRLSFGEMNDVLDQAMGRIKIEPTGPSGKPGSNVTISQKILKEVGLLKSIVEAPFAVNMQNIQELDPADGNAIFEAWSELNNQDFQKGPASSAPSEEGSQTFIQAKS